MLDRMKHLQQRNRVWVERHPWRYAILTGFWTGLVFGITEHFVDNASFQESAFAGLIMGSIFGLGWRIVVWPIMQRRRQNPPSRRRREWETAGEVGVLAWLATWNVIVLIFGFDTSFAIMMESSIVVGIAVALLVHQMIGTRKIPRKDLRE